MIVEWRCTQHATAEILYNVGGFGPVDDVQLAATIEFTTGHVGDMGRGEGASAAPET